MPLNVDLKTWAIRGLEGTSAARHQAFVLRILTMSYQQDYDHFACRTAAYRLPTLLIRHSDEVKLQAGRARSTVEDRGGLMCHVRGAPWRSTPEAKVAPLHIRERYLRYAPCIPSSTKIVSWKGVHLVNLSRAVLYMPVVSWPDDGLIGGEVEVA